MELPSRACTWPSIDVILDPTDFALIRQEWVWPIGYFLRAYLHFDIKAGVGKKDANETLHDIHSLLLEHRHFIQTDAWAGLPEL